MIKWFLNSGNKNKPLTISGYIKRALTLIIVFIVAYQIWVLIHILWWINFNPTSSAFMGHRLSIIQADKPNATLKHQWVDYQHISRHLKRAVIAAEDAKFNQHNGFDWEGIQRAWEKNLKKGKVVAGGSSISQQLAKNMFLSPSRTPWRKFEEILITFMLEAILSKQRIFEIYLNVIEWGNGVFGAEAASRHYFNRKAANVTAYQAAKLASMIPNPRYYDKHRNARGLVRKTNIIAKRMRFAQIPKN